MCKAFFNFMDYVFTILLVLNHAEPLDDISISSVL